MSDWRFKFRQDQCEFIIAAMDYVVARADDRLSKVTEEPFAKFAAARTKERALEIRAELADVIS